MSTGFQENAIPGLEVKTQIIQQAPMNKEEKRILVNLVKDTIASASVYYESCFKINKVMQYRGAGNIIEVLVNELNYDEEIAASAVKTWSKHSSYHYEELKGCNKTQIKFIHNTEPKYKENLLKIAKENLLVESFQ